MSWRIITKTLSALAAIKQKPLQPPGTFEIQNIAELQEIFRAMPLFETDGYTASEAIWRSNMNRLRELILTHDVRKFLRWDVITKTMFIDTASYIFKELNYLKHHSAWHTRWSAALKESPAGFSRPYAFYPVSSGNLIHHSYHLAQFEEKTQSQVHNLEYVFEFGGGYGSMCRLFYNLGFRGKYIIFDLPPFSALQEYYLKTLGIPVQTEKTFLKVKNNVICVSDIQYLEELLERIERQTKTENFLFIATWSLSESPANIRDAILPMISKSSSFLIAYQDKFGEVDNIEFFNDWMAAHSDRNWHNWPIDHLPGNHYLMGKILL